MSRAIVQDTVAVEIPGIEERVGERNSGSETGETEP
jgi:hypothetical protein